MNKTKISHTILVGFVFIVVAQGVASVVAAQESSREFGSNITKPMLESFKAFLSAHPNIAQDLNQKFELSVDRPYIDSHPALRGYYDNNREIAEAIKKHPQQFLSEAGVNSASEGSAITSQSLQRMRSYLASHREIANELTRNPGMGLARQYLDSHPDFYNFLNSNKEMFEEYKRHPKQMIDEALR
jgi:hypothetical protein